MGISNRICQQCGTPLAPGQEFCGNCGTRYFEPGELAATQYGGPSSYPGPITPGPAPLPPTQYAGPSPSPASPYGSSPYDSSPYGNTPYGSQGQSYVPPPPPSNVPYAGAPGLYGQQQLGQPGGGFPQAPQPPQPKKGPNVGLIIGIIALIVVVIGAGIFFVTRSSGSSGSSTSTSNSTSSGNSTIPTAQPTPQALFSDDFADNSQGWATGPTTGITRDISNHMFTLADTNQNQIAYEILPTTTTFDNFTVTMSFTFIQGDQNDGVGIYVRGDNNFNHDYRIEFGSNAYLIEKEYVDTSNKPNVASLVDITTTPLLHPMGQENQMTVIMKGSTLVLLINGTLVKTVTDSDNTKGQIALFVEHGNTSNGVKASFSSVAVYPAPAQLPS